MRRLAFVLVAAGLCLLGVWAYQLAATHRHQAVEHGQLEAALRAAAPVAAAQSTTGAKAVVSRARAANGRAWGRLEIDRVGLSVVLEEGVDEPTLRRSVGHLDGTAFPGEQGNVVLAGHRDGLFRPLREVRQGDRLRITTLDGSYEYEVSSLQVVPPERTDVAAPGTEPEVTLVTCYPFSYVGPAPQRYVVKARAISRAARAAAAN